MKREFHTKQKIAGFSLIELMVAMVIGLIVIGGTVSVYLASKRSYVEVERMARMTQNSRFAVQLISEALIHAGYTGELPAGSIELDTNLKPIAGTDCTDAAAAYDIEHYMFAAISDSNGDAFGCITDAQPGTGVILVKNVRPMRLTDEDENGTVETPETISAANTYIMANNVRGIMFDGRDTPPSILEGGDVPGGHAWIYQFQAYYVRDTGQLSRRVLDLKGAAMELKTEDLIEGVENMSFLFGLDSDGDGDIDLYKIAEDVTALEWGNIGAIQVNVLVKSDTADPQYIDTKTYNLGGIDSIGPLEDNFHRMVMQSTISLRNPKFVIRGNL
ncbi:MAG: prepilin-type N-terminal cleavage/methylation domain-containing protein [Gammaproteobacteria bacterium]|nr:prepilin-type N-terminal cleavage/methylation domain-containing protein [Gammaproteobacteria bacterium]